MKFKNLVVKKVNGIGIIKINRPEKLNALNTETIKELGKAVSEMADKEVEVVIFTGSGKDFCAGADIREMSSFDRKKAKQFADLLNGVLNKIENIKKPVIAAINGFALGAGNELAISCDMRIATQEAKFGQPETKLGIPPGAGAISRLPKIIGIAKAKELIYTGKIIDAKEAERIGLINKISTNPLGEAEKLAHDIIENSTKAINVSKSLLNDSMSNKKKIQSEIKEWVKFFSSKDQKEGMKAFLEKRKPRFKK